MKRLMFITITALFLAIIAIPRIGFAQRDTEIYFMLDNNPQEAWAYKNGNLVETFQILSG